MNALASERMTRPIGNIHEDVDVLAVTIKQRLRSSKRAGVGTLVYIDAVGNAFAPIADSLVAMKQPQAAIVGIYTQRASAQYVLDDLVAWKEAA